MLHFSKVIEEIYQRKKCEEEDEDKMSVERWHVHLYIFRDYLMGGCHVGEARLFGGIISPTVGWLVLLSLLHAMFGVYIYITNILCKN